MPVEVQMGNKFGPVTVYDAPGVMFKQAWDGEWGALGRTITDPSSLSPSERDSMTDRLKMAAGNSSVTNALVDVAMNPWVWMLFLTSPIGEKPVGDMFKLASKYTAYVMERAPLLASAGALTTQQALMNTRAGKAVNQFLRGQGEMLRSGEYVAFNDQLEKVILGNGLGKHGLEWQKYAAGSREATAAKEISVSLDAALRGADKDVTRMVPILKDGKMELQAVEFPREVMIDPRTILSKYGAEGLVDSARGSFKKTAEMVFKDERAVTRLWANLPKGLGEKMNAQELAGREMVRTVMGDLVKEVEAGTITREAFEGMVKTAVLDPIRKDQFYMPLNVVSTINKGKEVGGVPVKEARWASSMRVGGSAVPRQLNPVVYHPDDLLAQAEILGATEEGTKKYQQAVEILKDTSNHDRSVRFFRIRPSESIGKHVDSMSRTYAMFVQDVGPGVREVDGTLIGKMKPWGETGTDAATHRAAFGGKRAGLDKTLKEIEGTADEPMGGFTVADVLFADYGVARNWWQRDSIGKIVVPRLLGRVGTESLLKVSAITKGKQLMGAFLDTDAATAIEGGSDFGKKFIKTMREWGDNTDDAFEEGQQLQNWITKGLYSSHLALNIPSAIVNATQPFLFAGMWGGYGNVLKGYSEAFKEMGAYISKRAATGFKPITSYERAQLLRETHKFANWKGEDLLEVAGDTMENLEGRIFQSMLTEHKVKGKAERWLFEYPMALFSKAEIMNRNVAAHTAYYRTQQAISKGIKVSPELMVDNIRTLTRESQYGSHWMNTPQAFLDETTTLGSRGQGFITGRALANPLLRQFLTFPLRSFTAWTYTGPKLAGREGMQSLIGFANDTARGMAVSALGYEVAKSLTGADISRAGLASAVTDIVPGLSQGRIDSRDTATPLPLPPILDIPLDAIKGWIEEDQALLTRTLPRLLPAGVALSRMMGSMPDLGPLKFLGQKRYAGWNTLTSDGRAPVYDQTGNLIGLEGVGTLMAKSLGVDMGALGGESGMMQYLVKQRDEITNARREYMRMMVNGQSDKAERMAKEFDKRFKVPLTVTKAQWKEFLSRMDTPRVERQLDRMPPEVREEYAKIAGQAIPENFNVPPEALVGLSTAASRTPRESVLHPETVAAIREAIKAERVPNRRRAEQPGDNRWGPFSAADFNP